jgi:transcriptional regulator with XRE-family HTH domain
MGKRFDLHCETDGRTTVAGFEVPYVTCRFAEAAREISLGEPEPFADLSDALSDVHSRNLPNCAVTARGQSHTFGKDTSPRVSQTARMPRKAAKPSVNHLRAWREYRGLTQAQLAEKIDTTDNVISMLESGDRQLSPKWLNRLADALNTKPGFLYQFDPNDADLSILEAILDVPTDRKGEALRILRVFKTGTDD